MKKLFLILLLLSPSSALAGVKSVSVTPSICGLWTECIIGSLTSANFNVLTDQAITINPLTPGASGYVSSATHYKIVRIFVDNCSTSLTTAQGGFYTAVSKGGTIIGAITTPYTGCTSAITQADISAVTNMNTSIFTATTLYLSLTQAQGGAATGDVYVVGIPF